MMVRLRDYEITDAPRLVELANNERVSRYLIYTFPFPYTLRDAEWWIAKGSRQGGAQAKVIEHNGVFIGTVGIKPQSGWRDHIAEIGYWLGEEFWGRGLASEALKQMTERAFTVGAYRKLIAPVLAPNSASMKVLQKNGYELEGVLRREVVKNGQTYDIHHFAKHANKE